MLLLRTNTRRSKFVKIQFFREGYRLSGQSDKMAEDSATTMAQETENVSSVDVTKPSEPEASGVNTLATSDHKHQPVKTAQPSQQEDIEGLYSTLSKSLCIFPP